MTVSQGYKTFTGLGPEGGERSYVISREKARRVDFAIKLGRPLIVEGEAGCGKTRLADAIAAELGLASPIVIPVRSSSRVNDLFYRFDALRRLQDSGIPANQEQAQYAFNYISLEPLGKAIAEGQERVVLIDEVDKGDVDFQNDMLFALERFQFPIDEIPESEAELAAAKGLAPVMEWPGGRDSTAARPIILFSSNREKPLPKPFLRRCLYVELTFPDSVEDLTEIVQVNLRDRYRAGQSRVDSLRALSDRTVRAAVEAFLRMRDHAEKNNAVKKPATAELVDWVHVLHLEKVDPEDLALDLPPYWDILFKDWKDTEQIGRVLAPAAGGDQKPGAKPRR